MQISVCLLGALVSLWKVLKSLFMDHRSGDPSHSELLTAISSSHREYSVVYKEQAACLGEEAGEEKRLVQRHECKREGKGK